jgi:hypothetical protein
MATKADFSADEWKQIQRAPFMAGIAVVAASPSGPFGVIKEMFAVGKMLAEVKTRGAANELVKALVTDLESGAREQSAPAELQARRRSRSRALRSKAVDRRSRWSRRRRSRTRSKVSSNGWSPWPRRSLKPPRRVASLASEARK